MNKRDLIENIAEDMGITCVAAGRIVDCLVRVTTKALEDGKGVSIQGFGSLKILHQGVRPARNPRTNAVVMLEPRVTVRFKPGVDLLRILNTAKELPE